MRLEHQIKNIVNRIDEKSSHTPGQKDGVQEHPISKKTSDYEEKFFQHASEKDDREKFITGKKPEHKDNVEDTEGHENPVKKKDTKSPVETEEIEDVDEGLFDFEPRKKIIDPSMFSSKKDDIAKLIQFQQKALAMKPGDPKRTAMMKEIQKVKQRLGISEEVWEAIFFEEDLEDLNEIKKGFFMSDKSSNYAMSGYMPQSMVNMIRKAQNQFDWYPAIGQNGAKEDDKVVFKFEKPDGNTISGKPMSGKYKGKMFDYIIKPDNFKVPDAELKKHRLKDDMNIDLKQVENLQEKKKIENETFMAKIAHAAKKGKKEVKIGDKTHKVTMDKDTAHKIASEIETKESMSWEDAVKLATDTRSQSTKEYWEEKVKERQEGWGSTPGVAGKGGARTVKRKKVM